MRESRHGPPCRCFVYGMAPGSRLAPPQSAQPAATSLRPPTPKASLLGRRQRRPHTAVSLEETGPRARGCRPAKVGDDIYWAAPRRRLACRPVQRTFGSAGPDASLAAGRRTGARGERVVCALGGRNDSLPQAGGRRGHQGMPGLPMSTDSLRRLAWGEKDVSISISIRRESRQMRGR